MMSLLSRTSRNILRPYNFTRTHRQLFHRQRRGQANSSKNPEKGESQERTPLKEIFSLVGQTVLMSTITYQVVQIMWAEMAVTESKIITIARIEKIEERLKELTMTEHSMSTTTQNGKSNQDYSKTKHQTNNEEN